MTAPAATSSRRCPCKAVAIDDAAQRRGQHFLVAHLRIGAIAACERNAHAADDGDASRCCSDQHFHLRHYPATATARRPRLPVEENTPARDYEPMSPAYNRFMRRFLHSAPLGLALLALAACGAAPAPPPSRAAKPAAPGDQLSQLVEHYWDDYGLLNPQRLPQGAVSGADAAGGYDISAQFLADSLGARARLSRRGARDAAREPRPGIAPDLRHIHAATGIGRRELHLPLRTVAGQSRKVAAAAVRADRNGSGPIRGFERQGLRRLAGASRFLSHDGPPKPSPICGKECGADIRCRACWSRRCCRYWRRSGADTPANVFYRPLAAIPATAADSERARMIKGIGMGVRDQILPSYRTLARFPAQRVPASGTGERGHLRAAAGGCLVRLFDQERNRHRDGSRGHSRVGQSRGRSTARAIAGAARRNHLRGRCARAGRIDAPRLTPVLQHARRIC